MKIFCTGLLQQVLPIITEAEQNLDVFKMMSLKRRFEKLQQRSKWENKRGRLKC